MKLMVDFNKVGEGGLVPALVPHGYEADMKQGVVVELDDGEGTECLATVEEVAYRPTGILYVWVSPQPGTYRRTQPARSA